MYKPSIETLGEFQTFDSVLQIRISSPYPYFGQGSVPAVEADPEISIGYPSPSGKMILTQYLNRASHLRSLWLNVLSIYILIS